MDGPAKVSGASSAPGSAVRSRMRRSARPVPSGRLPIPSGRLPLMAQPIEDIPEIDPAILDRASRVIRVLGHPLRLRILNLLEATERNVTQLVVATGASQAVVSQQLRILRSEGIVDDRREGSRVFYQITEPKVSMILDCIRACDVPDMRALANADRTPGRSGLRLAEVDPDASELGPLLIR